MDVPQKIRNASRRLKEGHRVNRVTVRDFLSHFGAERRGAVKVEAIRQILDLLDLQTDPDFETAWIDEPIQLRLKEGTLSTPGDPVVSADAGPDVEEIVLESTPSAVEQAEEQSEQAPTSTEPEVSVGASSDTAPLEPTFRIGSLPAANKSLITVNQDDGVARAVTLMLEHDFSQLPVMQGQRDVKGVVTWKSIGSRTALGSKCDRVGDCREDARIIDANRTLFEAIPIIVEHGYVLVRQSDRRITGIVTTSDLSLQFQSLAEPFLLIREVELHLRQILRGKVEAQDFDLLARSNSNHRGQQIASLTLGEQINLLEHPQVWSKLRLGIDAKAFIALLHKVRLIRNDVMHFDQDPMTSEELGTLKRAVRMMQELHQLAR